jgi:hypothetical protein
MDYSMAGYQAAGPDSPFIGPNSSTRLTTTWHTLNPDLPTQTSDFISALSNFAHLSLLRSLRTFPSSPNRNTPFPPISPLNSILSPKPKNRIEKVSRFAALLHLNAALWDYRTSATLSERYLVRLDKRVREMELREGGGAPTLVWLMLQNETDVELRRPERTWFVG